MGGDLSIGEDDAAEVVRGTSEAADRTGRLRAELHAVRSHRVEDDFSHHWTYAREDFERKLYHKRSKIKAPFLELTDTIRVQCPKTQIAERLCSTIFWHNFSFSPREREVVVLLGSGTTNLTENAAIMDYRNHSPISKRLKHIRDTAAQFFGQD